VTSRAEPTRERRGASPGAGRPRWLAAPLAAGATVPVAVWSPAGGAAEGAPLLVFSHGYRQEPRAVAHLAEWLARRGWIVGAPRHRDGRRSGAELPGAGARERRCRELRAALDALLSPGAPGARAGPERIALAGHSLGGFTCLALAGAAPCPAERRARALLLLSPALYALSAEDYRRVEVATMILYSDGEREIRGWSPLTKAELAAIAHANLPPPTYLVETRGRGHYAFTSRASRRPMAWLRRGSAGELALTARLATAFLERHLLGREEAELPDPASRPLVVEWRGKPPAVAAPAGLSASEP
jgi:acetyl esterase/lipase